MLFLGKSALLGGEQEMLAIARALLVEQNARFALEVADRVYVLNDGKVVHTGPAQELAKDEARVRALAGAGASEH